MTDTLTWVGIALCISQSAMFSGLNLAFFGVSRLQLELEADTDPRAARVLKMREDSNFLLATILWGNVGVNVLLTLLSGSLLVGVSAFLFSTVVITFLGEILPQAYFSRNPIKMASLLSPILRAYQFLFYVVAKPSGLVLDAWLGKESVAYFQEQVIQDMLKKHVEAHDSDVGSVEGIGALNFLKIDDLCASKEGEVIDADSIIELPVDIDLPRFPDFNPDPSDPFLSQVNASGKKWIVLVDGQSKPYLVLDSDEFLRAAMFSAAKVNPYDYCHRPIIVSTGTKLGEVMSLLRQGRLRSDRVIENDVVLWWGDQPQIITGADLFDRLLQGVE